MKGAALYLRSAAQRIGDKLPAADHQRRGNQDRRQKLPKLDRAKDGQLHRLVGQRAALASGSQGFRMLRKVIRDGSPWCPGPYKDVSSRAVTGVIVEATHGDNRSTACLILERQSRPAYGAKGVREAFGIRRLERSQVLLSRCVAKGFERYE